MKRLFFFTLFFSFTSNLMALNLEPKPEFGVLKSWGKSLFLSCEMNEKEEKICTLYTQKKGKPAEAVSAKVRMVELSKADERSLSRIKAEGTGAELSPFAYLPFTFSSIVYGAYKNPAYMLLLPFIPLDLVAWTVGIPANGVYLLYKRIQEKYLEEALLVLFGKSKKKIMHLSRGDMKDLLSCMRKSF